LVKTFTDQTIIQKFARIGAFQTGSKSSAKTNNLNAFFVVDIYILISEGKGGILACALKKKRELDIL
jgi:hypothetical protein